MSDIREKAPWMSGIGEHIASWYRLTRILFSGFTALTISATLGLPIFYWQVDKGDASLLPYYFLIIIAGGIYGMCWWAFVGFDRDTVNRSYGGAKAGWMALLGLVSLVVLVGEIIGWFIIFTD